MQALSIDFYPGHILNPIPLVKWVLIEEGSLCLASYAMGVPSWGTFGMVALFP